MDDWVESKWWLRKSMIFIFFLCKRIEMGEINRKPALLWLETVLMVTVWMECLTQLLTTVENMVMENTN